MTRYVIRRLGFVLLTLWVMSLLIFLVTQILPGDVARMIMGQYATEAGLASLREKLGLNRPLYVQYFDWLFHFVMGDWGKSLATQVPIQPLVLQRLRNSAMLAVVGLVLSVPLAILLGVVAGLKRNTWLDSLISIGGLAFIGIPEFVSGVFLILVFALKLGWFPSSATIDPDVSFAAALPKLILPGITITLVILAYVVRMTRAGVVDVLGRPYVRTAVLKGLPRHEVIAQHILRNALLPTVTVVAMAMGWLIGGLIVTESVFSYPGLGRLLLFAITRRDVPLIQAVTMIIVAVFSLSNLLADILYAYLDPRIRLT